MSKIPFKINDKVTPRPLTNYEVRGNAYLKRLDKCRQIHIVTNVQEIISKGESVNQLIKTDILDEWVAGQYFVKSEWELDHDSLRQTDGFVLNESKLGGEQKLGKTYSDKA